MHGTNVGEKFFLNISKCYTGTRSLERPEQRKMGMKFGTCNVSTVYKPWPLKTMARELENCESYLVGAREVR